MLKTEVINYISHHYREFTSCHLQMGTQDFDVWDDEDAEQTHGYDPDYGEVMEKICKAYFRRENVSIHTGASESKLGSYFRVDDLIITQGPKRLGRKLYREVLIRELLRSTLGKGRLNTNLPPDVSELVVQLGGALMEFNCGNTESEVHTQYAHRIASQIYALQKGISFFDRVFLLAVYSVNFCFDPRTKIQKKDHISVHNWDFSRVWRSEAEWNAYDKRLAR